MIEAWLFTGPLPPRLAIPPSSYAEEVRVRRFMRSVRLDPSKSEKLAGVGWSGELKDSKGSKGLIVSVASAVLMKTYVPARSAFISAMFQLLFP